MTNDMSNNGVLCAKVKIINQGNPLILIILIQTINGPQKFSTSLARELSVRSSKNYFAPISPARHSAFATLRAILCYDSAPCHNWTT